MKKGSNIARLKVLMLSGKLNPESVAAIVDNSEPDERINLLKSPLGWYLEKISAEPDLFILVKKVCRYANINFLTLSNRSFFAICKAVKEQTAIIAQIIQDIQYPELTEIQKESGYGSKHFGTAGLICNIAEAFNISYLEAESQPVIAITKLRMQAHQATCQANEQKFKEMFKKQTN